MRISTSFRFGHLSSLRTSSLRALALSVVSRSLTVVLLLSILPAPVVPVSASGLRAHPDYITAADQNTTQADGLTHKVFLPSINKVRPSCAFPSTLNGFGVQMYGSTGFGSPYYDSMLGTGGDWVRVQVSWSDVEPANTSPSGYKWKSADANVSAAVDACKRIIVSIVSAPDWAATSPDSVIDKALPPDLQEFLFALVERYDGDGIADAPGAPVVLHWELYNEPDATDAVLGYEGWGNYPEEYAQMMADARPAIRAANANAQVLLGGLSYDNFEENGGHFSRSFLDDVLKAGGGEYFDIMNFHSYPLFGPDWIMEMNPDCVKTSSCEGPGLLEKTEYIRQELAAYKLTKPVIITESGWHSDGAIDLPSTPEIQARYVTELYVQSKAAGVNATIFFALVKPDNYPYDAGLITRDDPPKPKKSYTAYQTADSWLSDAKFIRRLTVNETKTDDMDAYRFYDPKTGRTFYVAWLNPARMGFDLDGNGKPDVPDEFQSLRLPGNEAKVYDIYGNLVETVTDTDGDVKVLIGGAPRYINVIR